MESTSLNVNEASVANYESNLKRFGDAIIEISQNGIGLTGWNKQSSRFPGLEYPFIMRGGSFKEDSGIGKLSFFYSKGVNNYSTGFRPVLVAN